MQLDCPYGVIHRIFDNGFGINTYDLEIRDGCLSTESNGNQLCGDVFNMTEVHRQFDEYCFNKTDCIIDFLTEEHHVIEAFIPNT